MQVSELSARREYAAKAFPPPVPHRLESLRGPGDSNVVLRGFLLHGPHPLGQTPAAVAQSLAPLLRAGVTCFVSMQQELPSVVTQAAVQARSTYGANTVVTARPSLRDAQALVDASASAPDAQGPLPQAGGPPLAFVHCPIAPQGPGVLPDADARRLCLELLAYMRAGESLYLHCSDGNGRSGTVAALLAGLAYNLGPVEAMQLAQKSRNDRGGSQGPCPETHEQRMQVHRLLSDAALRAQAAAVAPRHPESQLAESSAVLAATLAKVRSLLAKKGATSLIYLRRYAIRLAASAAGASPAVSPLDTGAGVALARPTFDRLCADAAWFLTAGEAGALWAAAVAATPPGAAPGCCDVLSLFRVVRGQLSARRAAAVHEAFDRLGGEHTGSVHIDALAAAFTANLHPDVKANRRTAAEVTAEFHDTFGVQARTEQHGGARALGGGGFRNVSVTDFEGYFADLSCALLDDAYFDLIVFGCFPSPPRDALLGGGSGGAAGTGELRGVAAVTAPPGRASAQAVAQRRSIFASALSGAAASSAAAAGAHGSGAPVRTTEGGYSFVDMSTLESTTSALHAHLVRVGPLAMAYLGAALRRHDTDRDGLVDSAEMRAALRDTVLACAPPAPGSGGAQGAGVGTGAGAGAGGAAVEHPLMVLDADSDAVFTAGVREFAPASLAAHRPLLPLEAFHARLRGPLSRERRAAVLSLFSQLDAGGQGAVPVARAMQAFRAEGHPAVAAGRASVPALYRQFQDSFGEAFAHEDRAGPSVRMRGGPAGEAYRGHGDGLVRMPFFEAWHEGISSLVEGDGDFNLVAFSIWNAAARSRGGAAAMGAGGFDPRAMAAKGDDGEAGLLSSMAKLGSVARGNQANASSTTFDQGARPGSRMGQALMQQAQAQQAQVQQAQMQAPADASGGMQAGALGRQRGGGAGGGGGGFFASDLGVVNGGTATNVGTSSMSTVGRSAAAPGGRASSDPEVDAALRTARGVLLPRGARGGFRLVRALEQAAGSVAGAALESTRMPVPMHVFVGALRDAGLGLGPQQIDALARHAAAGPGEAVMKSFLEALFPPLAGGRADVVRRAFEAVVRQAAQEDGALSPEGWPALATLQLSYSSAHHPDVKSGRAAEDAVLRAFLESFSGPTFADAHGGAFVSPDGFADYYGVVSFFEPHDASFATVVFQTWKLFAASGHSEGQAAGGGGSPRRGLQGEAQQERLGSVSEALGQGMARSRHDHLRGPGQDAPPPAAYAGGYGVSGKLDLTSRGKGWGIERGRY